MRSELAGRAVCKAEEDHQIEEDGGVERPQRINACSVSSEQSLTRPRPEGLSQTSREPVWIQ